MCLCHQPHWLSSQGGQDYLLLSGGSSDGGSFFGRSSLPLLWSSFCSFLVSRKRVFQKLFEAAQEVRQMQGMGHALSVPTPSTIAASRSKSAFQSASLLGWPCRRWMVIFHLQKSVLLKERGVILADFHLPLPGLLPSYLFLRFSSKYLQ